MIESGGLDSSPGPRRRRVLCLDDSLELLTLLRMFLEKRGYEVWTTDDEAAAMCLLAFADYIDIFTQDIDRRSRGDGLDFLLLIQANPRLRSIPMVVISGYPWSMADEFMSERGVDSCASLAGYLQKPFSFDQLIDMFESVTGNG